MADEQVVVIKKDGTAVPDRFILSKAGKNGLPKRVTWIADDKEHDFQVIFDGGKSPFTKEPIVVKGGGPEGSGDIKPEIKPNEDGTPYHYIVGSKAREIAADPEVIIRN